MLGLSDIAKISAAKGEDRDFKLAALAQTLIARDPLVGPVVVEEGAKLKPEERWAFWKKQYLNACDYFDVYTERPIGPREFVCGKQYLNQPDSLWPELLEIFCDINNGEYDVAVLTGGIGVGKTTLSIFTQAYQLYLLGCLRSPQRFYNQIETDEIVVIFQSLTATLAETVDYARFVQLVRGSPWFKEKFPPRGDLKSELHFPKRVIVKPASGSSTAAIGQNVIGGLIDEVNFMRVVENSKKGRGADGGTFDQAEELWNSIARRRESRFMLAGGRYPGVFCLLSSKQYPGEFTDRISASASKELAEKGVTRTYVYDKRAWEVRPDKFKDSKWFRVFIGDEARKPYIMEPGDVIKGKDAALVLDVPEEYRKSFDDNLLNALRDIGGVSTQALHPFMPNTNKVADAFNAKFPTIVSQDWCDFVEHQLALYPDRVVKPDEPRFVHIDLAISNDSAGVACGFVDRFVEIKNGPDVEIWPVVRFDYVLEVKPPRGDEISFHKIRELLYKQKDILKMNMRWATLDSYQSRDTIQTLRQRGWITGLQSIDTDLRPYTFLKGAILDGRVEAPMHEKARKELAQLEWNALKKTIDHPPTGSKDVADCMAGVVFGLTMRLEVWQRHKVKTRLPARLLAEAKKKDEIVAVV